MKKFLTLILALSLLLCSAAYAETAYDSTTYSSRGYDLLLYWPKDAEITDDVKQPIIDMYFLIYPQLRETYGICESRSVSVHLTDEPHNRISSLDGIFLNLSDFTASDENKNALIGLFANMIHGGYPNPDSDPAIDALCYGFQLYIQEAYAHFPRINSSVLPSYEEGQQLTDNHQVAAAFLTWVANTYGETVIIRMNRVLHEGYYQAENFWPFVTGFTLDELWEQYAASSAK